LQLPDSGTFETNSHIPPVEDAIAESDVFIADIHSAKKCSGAVQYGEFAVIASVEPGKTPSEGRPVEGVARYAGILQLAKIGAGRLDAAEIIVHEKNGYTTFCSVDQGFSEEGTAPVIAANVEFNTDVASCLGELAKHGWEKVSSIPEEFDFVSGEEGCLRVSPETLQKAGSAEDA
jgi:hypothetical protein